MLTLIGDPNDLTSVYMGWLASRRDIPTLTLAEERYGVDWWFNADEDAGLLELIAGDHAYGTRDITGAFIRFNPEPALPSGWSLGRSAAELFIQERRSAISEVIEALTCPVVNRPSAGRSNGAKPVHMARLQADGLSVPEWIASNEREAVLRFLDRCPEGAIVKAASGLRSHVRTVDATYLARLEAGTTPSVIQRYVSGYEVRVHVLNGKAFGSRVDADAIDYRFDAENVKYSRHTVPDAIARLCSAAAAREGLVLAGLDFRVARDGHWWCLEMNPVPTFLPYEASTGHAIGDSILDYLVGARFDGARESPLAAFVRSTTNSSVLTKPIESSDAGSHSPPLADPSIKSVRDEAITLNLD